MMQRRKFLKMTGLGSTSLALAGNAAAAFVKQNDAIIEIVPTPLFELSKHLYMQFMEPLGTTDSSVEAAWDHGKNDWKETVIKATKELAPGMMRWGGNLSAYYKWQEGVGPRHKRVPLFNTDWGGIETSQVGTAEFVDFCRRVGNADPLMCVNFESDGLPRYAVNPRGEKRSGNAAEAAAWVDYCNNPSNRLRLSHGHKDPLTIRYWQLGNETSYRPGKGFDNLTAAKKTVEFAKAMRAVDPSLKLIGWGDDGWNKILFEEAGDQIDYIAFHHMFDPGQGLSNSPVRNNEYRKDIAATWDVLMRGYTIHEQKINKLRTETAAYKLPLALTECHYSIEGRNRCEVLSSWAAGVSYARIMNLHERNGDVLKIATMADFCGTRWQVNALMIPVPGGEAFLMPAAKVMQLYKQHTGKEFIKTTKTPPALDVTASKTGNTCYLHVVNTDRINAVTAALSIAGATFTKGIAYEIAADPTFEIMSYQNDILKPVKKEIQPGEAYKFLPASVTAIELTM
ncbi:alpha-L-arabinofuranosidase [Panacibacter sp. DH6]|uniref:non-reducing end alpha-L-arabinofuranosidase n=1 Tax=Panacibacter microcysteis TaxID=2793269 RepID=A0A931E795_9BACT|nr:alpha-L-arabinofuranosidase C-terminal domain-containing protein [Panacibacter microcysteis]MBG9375046.1 alpha-L-arabinofuranosidase [Panacibacter microcysteis]